MNKSQLNFSYEVLEKATNYFHDSNKLGQGGSGSVYKVISPFVLRRYQISVNGIDWGVFPLCQHREFCRMARLLP